MSFSTSLSNDDVLELIFDIQNARKMARTICGHIPGRERPRRVHVNREPAACPFPAVQVFGG